MSRPVWGAWIEIDDRHHQPFDQQESRPVWGAWIEISIYLHIIKRKMSRPVWGAWIEMKACCCPSRSGICRAPYGARGLKYHLTGVWVGLVSSRPVWGAWIEICDTAADSSARPSRPVWGAWIEINTSHHQFASLFVAPRMGRVD